MSEGCRVYWPTQVFNPLLKRWVKLDTETGRVIATKRTPGPWADTSRWHLIDQPDHEANVRAQGGRG